MSDLKSDMERVGLYGTDGEGVYLGKHDGDNERGFVGQDLAGADGFIGADRPGDEEPKTDPAAYPPAPTYIGEDPAMVRRYNRQNALDSAIRLEGKHAKADKVVETAGKFLKFLED